MTITNRKRNARQSATDGDALVRRDGNFVLMRDMRTRGRKRRYHLAYWAVAPEQKGEVPA